MARELELARRHLDRARELAQTPVHRETLEQLDALHAHLTRFVEAVRTGMPKFNAADELHVGDDVVAVIESEPERLSLRVAGVRRDYTPATLPAAIALVVAKAGADENAPASQAFLGAFHAADPLGDRAAVRDYLKSAAAAGLAVDPLLHLLDQDVLDDSPRSRAQCRATGDGRAAGGRRVCGAHQGSEVDRAKVVSV